MTRRVFITATDTDAGKTWVTSGAVRAFLAAGVDARAVKPIACGLDAAGGNEDIAALLDAQGLQDTDAISLYRFALPAAPALAAAAEGRSIVPAELLRWCDGQSADLTLIEGVGGLMVPLSDGWLVSDWIAAMPGCEIWLVVGCRLGAMNHALLTLSVLRQMGREPARIIFNAATAADESWLEPVRQAVVPFLPAGCRLQLLHHGDLFVPLSECI
ncbi:MAG: dethiobiotin synthase [Zetaproteobacteria bacterium CG12_big_fil_rev_8_21_14_0_65_54_13]|nr:MAG: dethiobiotin synthase [Zetaproteobacteria bacterium CG23_combo_of_CG06-09_8_20_14_all_54_7]PIW48268.1 MAG: dethiobiotin synthase [Zetaproteobacteria bacterium CG12_big_fil_rev_8_21_14_0_65_54_13]PIX54568.1 MAG: dethiobiotin synthase [Zetaproteobacteria bacterium CG_4_10_14_3_um_filter_54_28]PJA29714.1 MAG: dethiobiotin synthase [Zetaproteobacteria bacterium CG_4_9_14_3_um_filter_54_145]